MSYVLQTNHLTKMLGDNELVSDVNIHIKKGEIYGFLGPNGAGKTTVMKMIANLWKPTNGTIEVLNQIITPTSYEYLKRIGFIIEFPTFFEELSGKKNLELHSEYMGFYSPDGIEKTLSLLDLTQAMDKPVKSYSLGMKQRLGIARAILSKPELLILDEPTNGLDPAGMKQIRYLLQMLCKEYGITIMVSSHILSEVESIADTIGIINHGKLMQEIALKDINEMGLMYISLAVEDVKKASYVLDGILNLNNFKVVDDHTIRIYDRTITTAELTRVLTMNDIKVDELIRKSESLEDYFLKLTMEEGKVC